jgi:ABC-type Na+ transport system ATPase subunit NatA
MSVIEVDNPHKRYGEHVAVQDVSFAVEEGEIFGILGPNSAGIEARAAGLQVLARPRHELGARSSRSAR